MRLIILFVFCHAATTLTAAESWSDVLARMPLVCPAEQLQRTNCVEVMLRSFQSNAVLKALIFMPGATDEFYMFKRVQPHVRAHDPSLLDAVTALTNQSFIQIAVRPPFFLLHTTEDSLDPVVVIQHQPTAEKLRARHFASPFLANDRDWDFVQPIARDKLHTDLRPWRFSRDSWHFYRHSFAAFDLNGWEALEALALAGKSRFTVARNRVTFEPDLRTGVAPGFTPVKMGAKTVP